MSSQDHILIVDDDRDIRTLLAGYLEKQGLRCITACDGREMRTALENHRIDLIVLDIMMPGEDGLTLCRNLRASDSPNAGTPVLMLTARSEDMDRIIGLEMGADDYLPKPFVPRELYARVRAILRRARALPPNMAATPATQGRELHFTHWRLDTVARHLIDQDGTIVALSGAEFRILSIFLAHPQKVLSRDQLMELTQGREADVFDRSIDLLISRVRQRLNDNAREPAIIKTVRNEGYVLACEVTQAEPS
ncbi:MAG: response regulator [Azoarcus sp.]|jgi:two-component system OmpR family response regulator|nr:response regulator [Azoarcus sp.]